MKTIDLFNKLNTEYEVSTRADKGLLTRALSFLRVQISKGKTDIENIETDSFFDIWGADYRAEAMSWQPIHRHNRVGKAVVRCLKKAMGVEVPKYHCGIRLRDLTDCIVNGHEIQIFEYDTEKIIYAGLNLEKESATQMTNKVLYISADKSKINIGVKGGAK